jgi:hypothetical protein
MAQHQPDPSDEFSAAKKIVEALKGLERPQQERAIRFASEALGLQLAKSPSVAPSPTLSVAAGSQPSAGTHFTTSETNRQVDIRQFAASKNPKSDQQFAAVVAYYYQFEAPPDERTDVINAEILGNAARLTNRRRPSRHALNNAKRAGYLDSTGHGNFRLNTVGENLVAITLPGGEASSGARAVARPKPTRRKRKTSAKKKRL